MALMSMLGGDLGAMGGPAGGFGDVALGANEMQKILGLFAEDKTGDAALLNAMRPVMGASAVSPGHISPSQVKGEDVKIAGQGVVPGLAQLLGMRG